MPASPSLAALNAELDDLRHRLDDLQSRLPRELHDLPAAPAAHGSAAKAPVGATAALLCRLGSDEIALPLSTVDAVVLACSLHEISEAPSWVSGLLTFEGTSIPVVDLVARAADRRRRLDLTDLIVVCRDRGRRLGLVVQGASGAHRGGLTMESQALEAVPHAPYVAGLARASGRPVLVIDVGRLLAMVAPKEQAHG